MPGVVLICAVKPIFGLDFMAKQRAISLKNTNPETFERKKEIFVMVLEKYVKTWA